MPDLSAHERRKMIGILGRLQSNQTGEIIAAAHLANAMLQKAGVTWHDLLSRAPNPPDESGSGWRTLVASCLQHPGLLSEWERRFLSGLWRRPTITDGQRQKLDQIAHDLRDRKAW